MVYTIYTSQMGEGEYLEKDFRRICYCQMCNIASTFFRINLNHRYLMSGAERMFKGPHLEKSEVNVRSVTRKGSASPLKPVPERVKDIPKNFDEKRALMGN